MSARPLKVLILGGYGTFGGRLARLLSDEAGLELIIAGRSAWRAEDFCRALPRAGTLTPARIDRDGDVAGQIARLAPDVVVDASGPFQVYARDGGEGGDPYRVARAAIACGAHYVDLADDPDFVRGIRALEPAAWEAGVFALSGASTCPSLTAAAVRRLSEGLAHVDIIRGGITPSPHAGVGANVVRAIASYAGRSILHRRDGADATGYALMDSRRMTVGAPGALPLKRQRFSLVNVPDLALFPELWPDVREVWMGVAPRPAVWHRALSLCAWLVRLKLVRSLTAIAPLMHAVSSTARWGEHRGGLFVDVEGRVEDGRQVRRVWHLVAEGDDGPLIPAMAAEAIVRRVRAGQPPAPGARPATGDVSLEEYEELFARHAITTGVWEPAPADAPLYRRILGAAWDALPAPIRAMHDVGDAAVAEGRAKVERGHGPLARLAAAVIGFPDAGEDVPVRVDFSVKPGSRGQGAREVWRRTFGTESFESVQSAGRGGAERLVTERFGPLAFDMALVVEGERLRLVIRGWRAFGVPMPAWFAPRGDSYEHVVDGRFNFHVEIKHPLAGLIVRYRGWLERRM